MSPSATTAGTERLLHCSPARTVWKSIDPATGDPLVIKIFVSGSQADADHEVAMGQLAAGHGAVRYRASTVDPSSNRPCVTMDYEPGIDLGQLVAEQGALPSALACHLLAPVAETLARLHSLTTASAPRGICHGDIKPRNLLRTAGTTLLLDFEHARRLPHGGSSKPNQGPTFTGGSRNFAPPEADQGAPPDAAFDVFGLGATLQWVTTLGGLTALPQHPDFRVLVAACTAPSPADRPTAAALATQLRELALTLERDPAETVLDDWARATLDAKFGDGVGSDLPGELLRPWRRRRRLVQSLPHLLDIPQAIPTEPSALLRELLTTARVLQRFPRHAPTLRWRRELARAAGQLLANAAQHVHTLRKAEEFDAATEWLASLQQLTNAALAMPGGCPIPYTDPPASLGPLHRDPIAYLQRLAQQLPGAREELALEDAAITAAEQRLDLRGAEQAIEKMASHYGGVSPTATRRRDQLHRLRFYLDRVARAEANVERVGPLWDASALQPLATFVAAAAAASQHHPRSELSGGTVGLRSLQITLVNLAEEFPHLPQVSPALDALTQALGHLTDQAWQLLTEAQQRLQTVPVPVRPLQVGLRRLDTYRVLEAFIDRNDRPRSQLQDGIEALRLSLEQARATRDRLAEGAEQALSRGHWTTGLFDMERAVAGLNPVDEHEKVQAVRLQQRLDEVRRRKQEVEAAVRRNVELTTSYGMLQDDPSSTFASRLHVLDERRDCLHFLAMHVPAERGALYSSDLREVETQIALEQASLAEHQLDGTEDPLERLRLARATLERFSATMSGSNQEMEPPGRMVRLFEHWRTVASRCQRAVDQLHEQELLRQRQRRRMWATAVGACLISSTAIGLAARSWFVGEPAIAASTEPTATDLLRLSAALPADLSGPAEDLRLISLLATTNTATFDHRAWHEALRTQLLHFVHCSAAAGAPPTANSFATACWDCGLSAADARLDEAARAELDHLTSALVEQLAPTGLRPSRWARQPR